MEQNTFNFPSISNFKNIKGNINSEYVVFLETIFRKASAIVKKKQEQEGIGKHFVCNFTQCALKTLPSACGCKSPLDASKLNVIIW